MPFYQQIVVTMPKYPKDLLVTLFRKHTKTILDNGGVVRGIENHGIRPLLERATRKYAHTDGSRHFWEARYVTVSFDASPSCLQETERMMRMEEGVLRVFTTKVDTHINKVNSKNFKNPYLDMSSVLPPAKESS